MKKLLSAIILVEQEINSLADVIRSIANLFPYEILVVINENMEINQNVSNEFGCKYILYNQENYYAARVLGAKEAKGDVLLFLDANTVIPPLELKKFVQPTLEGTSDVVLNNLQSFFLERQRKQWPDSNTVWRQMVNEILGKKEFHINSILSLPHAITKDALKKINSESLVNPVLAHMRLIEKNQYFNCHYSIDTTLSKEFCLEDQDLNKRSLSVDERQIMNKHLDALAEWLKKNGTRGTYTDGIRKRDYIKILKENKHIPFSQKGWGMKSLIYNGKQLSIIIPAQNEESTIEQVIREARKIEPLEIIVIVNGSTDNTANIAKKLGATVIVYKDALGHDVGRAIGAMGAKGDILLFLDGDIMLPAKDLHPFSQAIADGFDIALNDLNPYLSRYFPLHIVTLFKYALNLACDRKDLGIGSFTAVPHAISREFLNDVGWDALICPSVVQVKAALNGHKISCVHYADVIKTNRIRPNQNVVAKGYSPTTSLILGDHLEGFSYLFQSRGE
ncbi:glycosyltransferase [Bacillus cereus]|nr:glycosyltransferase [Bacillus cereus]